MILLLLIESLMQKEISLPIKERIYQAAFVFLVLFAVMVIYNDTGEDLARPDQNALVRVDASFAWHRPVLSACYVLGLARVRYNVSQRLNMPATEMVHVRIDKRTKARAAKALAAMGLSVSDAVRVLLTRVAGGEISALRSKHSQCRHGCSYA